jgi:hypothetical protein
VEVFFFGKPFGVLPSVPGVADGESSKKAAKAEKDDELYPEWRQRATHRYTIEAEGEGFRVRLCNANFEPYAERPFAFCLEGYPEVRGDTDEDGYVIVDSQPAGAQGYVEVWPYDELPDDSVRWEISIGPVISPATPRGASMRLANLDYYDGDPTDEMTDELRDAIRSFQEDNEGLKVTGELDDKTCARLRALHEWEEDSTVEDGDADSDDGSEEGSEGTQAALEDKGAT